jgi:PAS domain S-box-containing protein
MADLPSRKIYVDKSNIFNAEFFDNLPVGISRTTLEGKIVFCNKAYAKMFGFDSVGELTDYPVINLYVNKEDRGNFVKLIIDKGWVEELPMPFRRRDGATIWCALTSKVVLDDDGVVVFFDGIARDVTERLKIQREKLAGEKFRGVLEMAGGVAHNLNQPLMIITNLLEEVLSELSPDDRIYAKMERINDQIKKLNKIAKKIRGVKKYKTMDYVGGEKIVDIDEIS